MLRQQLTVQIPIGRNNARILNGGHALFVEVGHDSKQSVALLLMSVGRDEMPHQVLCRFLQHSCGLTVGVSIDGSSGWILGLARESRQLHRGAVRNAIVTRGVL